MESVADQVKLRLAERGYREAYSLPTPHGGTFSLYLSPSGMHKPVLFDRGGGVNIYGWIAGAHDDPTHEGYQQELEAVLSAI